MSFVSCIDGAKDMERIVKQDCTRPKPWARRIVSRRVYLMLHSRSHTHTHTHAWIREKERLLIAKKKEKTKRKKEEGRVIASWVNAINLSLSDALAFACKPAILLPLKPILVKFLLIKVAWFRLTLLNASENRNIFDSDPLEFLLPRRAIQGMYSIPACLARIQRPAAVFQTCLVTLAPCLDAVQLIQQYTVLSLHLSHAICYCRVREDARRRSYTNTHREKST